MGTISRSAGSTRMPPRELASLCVEVAGPDLRCQPRIASGKTPGLLARRGVIADVCRFEMELQHARSTGQEELAARLTAYVDMLAGDLLEEISP